jgi:hypothetical protein
MLFRAEGTGGLNRYFWDANLLSILNKYIAKGLT